MDLPGTDWLLPPVPQPEASIAEAFKTADARLTAWSDAVQEADAALQAREERQVEQARRVIDYATALRGLLDQLSVRMTEVRIKRP